MGLYEQAEQLLAKVVGWSRHSKKLRQQQDSSHPCPNHKFF